MKWLAQRSPLRVWLWVLQVFLALTGVCIRTLIPKSCDHSSVVSLRDGLHPGSK